MQVASAKYGSSQLATGEAALKRNLSLVVVDLAGCEMMGPGQPRAFRKSNRCDLATRPT